MKIVLDASMSLAWLFSRDSEEERVQAEQALNAMEFARVEVPQLWLVEVGNALLVGERRKLISGSRSIEFLARLKELPIVVDSATISERMPFILQYAREFSLSAYDATYLDLAQRSGAQLATFDKNSLRPRAKPVARSTEDCHNSPTPGFSKQGTTSPRSVTSSFMP